MNLALQNALLTAVHLLIICFNLLGWIPVATRRLHFWFAMITLFCWTILGIWFGLGYCPITDWQWAIKEKLGETNLPGSFVKYFADKTFNYNFNSDLIDALTLTSFLVAIIISIKLNFFREKAI